MNRNRALLPLLLLAAPILAGLSQPAAAAGAGALQSPYDATFFRQNASENFSNPFSLQSVGGGKVQGSLSSIPVKGKINSKGVVTFGGQGPSEGGVIKITKGKAQLSAAGRFLLGTFKVKGTGSGSDEAGPYIFRAEGSTPTILSGPGLRTQGGGPGIGFVSPLYSGAYHDNKESSAEDNVFNIQITDEDDGTGKFVATISGVTVKGKVTGNKVSFKGKASEMGSSLEYQGSGQFDFTHFVLIGKLSFKGTGIFSSGKGAFEVYASKAP